MSSKKKLRIKGNIDDVLSKHNLSSKAFTNKKSKTNSEPQVIEVVKTNSKEEKPILEFKKEVKSTSSETKQELKPKPESKPVPKPKPELESEPEPKSEIKPKSEPKLKSEPSIVKSNQPQKVRYNKLSPKRSPINSNYNILNKRRQVNNLPTNNPKQSTSKPISNSVADSNLKPITIDLNYTVCGEKPKTLTKKKQRELEMFLNKKFIPSNKTPEYKRKVSPMSNVYREQLEKVSNEKSHVRHTNRISKINELVNNRDVKVFRRDSQQSQQSHSQVQA